MSVIPGTPKVSIVTGGEFGDGEINRGGIFDTELHEWRGLSRNPVVWFASSHQARLALHGPDLPDKLLAYGAMGSGKTEGALAPWAILRSFDLASYGRPLEIGLTAPTGARTMLIHRALIKRMPRDWYTWRAKDRLLTMALGITMRLITTTQHSADTGSPIQGWNWAAWAGDEYQDQIDRWDDIEMRGREAPEGRYYQLGTCTAKDSSKWKTARDELLAKEVNGTKVWHVERMRGESNPFVPASFWAHLRATLPKRLIKRLLDAEDVGPERATYPSFERQANLGMIPLGAVDVTMRVLADWSDNLAALVAHDPGKLVDVSEVLKAYRVPGFRLHHWYVVDEIITHHGSTDTHIKELLARLRSRWGCHMLGSDGKEYEDGKRALVRIDPYGKSDSKTKPHRTTLRWFEAAGMLALNAASTSKGAPGYVPKDAGIKMIDRLFGVERLHIACDDRGAPAAPKLLEAVEQQERDPYTGEAEVLEKKGTPRDTSHYTACVRYGLWLLEKMPLDQDESYQATTLGVR